MAGGADIVRSYCEGTEKSLRSLVVEQNVTDDVRLKHLVARETSEQDFFAAFVALAPDRSAPQFLPKGAINDPAYADEIAGLGPSLLAAYGCSLIREPLLGRFEGRFLNVHLGLSPYYRGAGTNFWPLVNGEPEYVGATFMHIDAGVDTGEIVHQIRAQVRSGDKPHDIGNRLIRDMALVYAELIRNFDSLEPMAQLPISGDEKVFRKRDFTEDAVRKLYRGFKAGLVEDYLAEQEARCAAVPIIENPVVQPVHALLEAVG